ncbi:hypothetical protein F5878DRAFT_667075 [Lentinula raphanica]|uniref:DUF4100 domain-containing protein n=1 Tax=Lentinula raphanica TaxID=153919 RepID=A0AA38NWG1_9AGAR|nr:hypothetical protein F5878DRAFT_667075 [Lentinula raphanica]
MSDPLTTLSASTTMSDVSQRPAIIMPMPVPGMPDAPRFEGKEMREFLKQIEAHGMRAGITDPNRLVDYIVHYSSRSIKNDIRFMPKFDPEIEDKTWDSASRMLLQMFSAHEEPPEITMRDLEDSCILWSNEEPIELGRSRLKKLRYTLPNGQDLLRIPFGVSGGVAGMLRGAVSTNPTNGVEHNGPVLSSSPASISYGSASIFGNNVFRVASLDQQRMEEVLEGQSYPSLRSRRDTTHFNPTSQQGRENKKRINRDPNNFDKPGYRPPESRGVPPEPTITTEKPKKHEE